MNKKASILPVVAVLLGLIFIGALIMGGTYNSLVQKDLTAEQMWANVETAYQRRADLIPNLVETVKGAKNFEQETLTKITELRSQAGQVQQQVYNAKNSDELASAGTEMNSVLSRLLVIVEAYPDLKSNQNFLELQSQLEGTENRIKYERDNYNTAVKDYKAATLSFPSNMIAGMFGFSPDKHKMFEAQPGAETAPKVTF